MNKERARELASEWNKRFHEGDIMLSDAIEQAILAACAEQRESDAKACDAIAEELREYSERNFLAEDGIAKGCAEAIRKGE